MKTIVLALILGFLGSSAEASFWELLKMYALYRNSLSLDEVCAAFEKGGQMRFYCERGGQRIRWGKMHCGGGEEGGIALAYSKKGWNHTSFESVGRTMKGWNFLGINPVCQLNGTFPLTRSKAAKCTKNMLKFEKKWDKNVGNYDHWGTVHGKCIVTYLTPEKIQKVRGVEIVGPYGGLWMEDDDEDDEDEEDEEDEEDDEEEDEGEDGDEEDSSEGGKGKYRGRMHRRKSIGEGNESNSGEDDEENYEDEVVRSPLKRNNGKLHENKGNIFFFLLSILCYF
uniref:Variant surface glycoprotein n=1 Tax=Trypanosoma brucei TaxID=5691 RepID=Q57WN2_9TRYP|nr:hypothetical protein Tb08.27P2.90 [Trypanosoma brucei]